MKAAYPKKYNWLLLAGFFLVFSPAWAKNHAFPAAKSYAEADSVLVSLGDSALVLFQKADGAITLSLDPTHDPQGLWTDQRLMVVKGSGYFPKEHASKISLPRTMVIEISPELTQKLAEMKPAQGRPTQGPVNPPRLMVIYLKKMSDTQYSIQKIAQEDLNDYSSFLGSLPSPSVSLIRKKYKMATRLIFPERQLQDDDLFDQLMWNFTCEVLKTKGMISDQDFRDMGLRGDWSKKGTVFDVVLDTDGRGHFSDGLTVRQEKGKLVLLHSQWYATPKPEETKHQVRVFPGARLIRTKSNEDKAVGEDP